MSVKPKFDYLIVGFGLAGAFAALELQRRGRSFLVIDSSKESSSNVAAGVVNPVVLKRFTAIWKANDLLDLFSKTREILRDQLGDDFFRPWPVYRIFKNEAEQITWSKKREHEPLSWFLDEVKNVDLVGVKAPFGVGAVKHCGLFKVRDFLQAFREKLLFQNRFVHDELDYSSLQIRQNEVEYYGDLFSKVIFAEGWGVRKNPYFNWINLQGNKGEALLVKPEKPVENKIIKSKHFLFPWSDEWHYAGGTYQPNDKELSPTPWAEQVLNDSLNELLDDNFIVHQQLVGIRPTVKDRRPVVGKHPEYANLFVLNGLGTRGVLLAPYSVRILISYVENQATFPDELNCNRFWMG